MFLGCVAVAGAMLAASGACSQHEPGPYGGGGRSFEVPTATGSSVTPDAGPDTFVLPDTSIGN